ncbi:MAG: hypothetical protein U0Q12_25140 [Vicinamibacterales bacterium]
MKKPLFGLLIGAVLGAIDGLTALVSTPEVAPEIGRIIVGSTMKGIVSGYLIGVIAARTRSLAVGILGGLLVGLFFAYLVALANEMQLGRNYYWQIMLPGGIVGVIVGLATSWHRERGSPTAEVSR